MNLEKTLRDAMKADGRTVYAFARDSGLRVSLVQRFYKNGGGLTLASASKLCGLLGLDLRPLAPRQKEV
ncbi:MAG TPA: helix-turn-helix domain-containing protein [Phycisphaerae bacterium]|nr:helix-turn-helix domain-containing protein [Phycisphaerae bacterium]